MATIRKTISGAQTGADRAALDFAIERSIPQGGWCPRGRLHPKAERPRTTPSDVADTEVWTSRFAVSLKHAMKAKPFRLLPLVWNCVVGPLILSQATAQAHSPVIPPDVIGNIRSRVTNAITPGIVVGMINTTGTTYFSFGGQRVAVRQGKS